MKYLMEPYPEDLDDYPPEKLRYLHIRNCVRKALNALRGEGVKAWARSLLKSLPAEER